MVILLGFAGPLRADWQHLDTSDGLAANRVFAVLEDASGDLWFGTYHDGGISRYDGLRWTTYTTADGLVNNDVWAIHEDWRGRLWFATYGGGVATYDGQDWSTYTSSDGLAGDDVRAIAEIGSLALWFGTSGQGVSYYDGVNWSTYTTADGLAGNDVRAVHVDSSGDSWFGTYGGGLSRFDGATWTTYTTADGLAGNAVWAIHEDRTGALWFGTSGGVSYFHDNTWTTYTTTDGLAYNDVRSVLEDRHGNLWFGTYGGGVSRFDGVGWLTYALPEGLSRVHSICEDSSGNLWFGTHEHGVFRYDGVTWTTYHDVDGDTYEDWIYGVVEDSSQRVWFATLGAGVSCLDGVSWTTYTTLDGLASNDVRAVAEDHEGDMWFGTYGGGISRYDGTEWTTYTAADGLADNFIRSITVDSFGELWIGTVGSGVSRYDGVNWTTYTTEDGLGGHDVRAICEDSEGDMWFATWGGGVSRFDGSDWVTFTTQDGLVDTDVRGILEDSAGRMWFGTYRGISRYDGGVWSTFTTADGIASNNVGPMLEDTAGNLWFTTWGGGVSLYDGSYWTIFTASDGLAGNDVGCVTEDGLGRLWFGTRSGATVLGLDLVPPQTVISHGPTPLSTDRRQVVGFAAAFGEARSIRFSCSFDESPWSGWTAAGSWVMDGIADGEHEFRVVARDGAANVDSTPAAVAFEVDATPPLPVVTSPLHGDAVSDSLTIVGTAADLRFGRFTVAARLVGTSIWESLATAYTPVVDGVLSCWNTAEVPDGYYELRLSVVDTLGLTGSTLVMVEVDNESPSASETSPVQISAATGGYVCTVNREVSLYFPPHAFAGDTEVAVDPADSSAVPDTLPCGAALVLPGYVAAWGGADLRKQAVLEMALERPHDLPDGRVMSLYASYTRDGWVRLGGTVASDGLAIRAAVDRPGMYALYLDDGGDSGDGLSGLTLTPRVLSSTGVVGREEVSVGFVLGRAGRVTASVYCRSGRTVRTLVSGERMDAGANLLSWDGRDDEGDLAPDGLYVICVEALGSKLVETAAVTK
jgi:ligand-binding sensor domain-containing protein